LDEVFADFGFGEDGQRVRTLAGGTDALAFCMSGLSPGAARLLF
jgi:hypothetical protein